MDITNMERKELAIFINEVRELIADVEKTHKYSMSKIYGLANKVFSQNETAQSCASCLIRKIDELRAWYTDANKKYAEMSVERKLATLAI